MVLVKQINAEFSRFSDDGVYIKWRLLDHKKAVIDSGDVLINAKGNAISGPPSFGLKGTLKTFASPIDASSIILDVVDLETAGPLTISVLDPNGSILATTTFAAADDNATQSIELPLRRVPWLLYGGLAITGILALMSLSRRNRY